LNDWLVGELCSKLVDLAASDERIRFLKMKMIADKGLLLLFTYSIITYPSSNLLPYYGR
jgi:hypothetical protein